MKEFLGRGFGLSRGLCVQRRIQHSGHIYVSNKVRIKCCLFPVLESTCLESRGHCTLLGNVYIMTVSRKYLPNVVARPC
jgi:hypothetical protein